MIWDGIMIVLLIFFGMMIGYLAYFLPLRREIRRVYREVLKCNLRLPWFSHEETEEIYRNRRFKAAAEVARRFSNDSNDSNDSKE